MAPIAIQNASELTSTDFKQIITKSNPSVTTMKLTNTGIENTVEKTAPSITDNDPTTPINELDASKLIFERNNSPKAVPEPNSPELWAQNVCTDHMITCSWTSSAGWSAPYLKPYGPLSLMPTASVLHYATECFEGLKLYRGYDGKLRLFRPDRNSRRMLSSATRIALPEFDPKELQKLIEVLVATDGEKWLPKSRPGSFLYLRPTMIANDNHLGVRRPNEALLYIIACLFPSFDTGRGTAGLDANPALREKERLGLKLLASKEDTVRAWPGGFGFAKVGANYGPSLIAHGEAKARGFDQVLWLLGNECDITEAGASNFFVVWRTREGKVQLVTAPLGDKIILDGVTRRSVLELARERLDGQLEVVERRYTMCEVEEAVEEGRLLEAFAAGTAVSVMSQNQGGNLLTNLQYFIAPVAKINFRGTDLEISTSEGDSGKYAAVLKTWLKEIMYGQKQHEWGVVVEERQLDA